jgi:Ca2+-binding EF-hand superfamily protein
LGAPYVRPFLTAALQTELSEAFAFFDGDRDGRLNVAELLQVLRACGFALSDAEGRGLAQGVEVRYGGLLSLPQLISVAQGSVCPRVPQLSAAEAVKELRGVRGWCTPTVAEGSGFTAEAHAVMRTVLTQSGDRLTPAEFVQLLRLEAPPRFRALAASQELLTLHKRGVAVAAEKAADTSKLAAAFFDPHRS